MQQASQSRPAYSHFSPIVCILSTAGGGLGEGLGEGRKVVGAAEVVAKVGIRTQADLPRCLHQRCEDVHRPRSKLAAGVLPADRSNNVLKGEVR